MQDKILKAAVAGKREQKVLEYQRTRNQKILDELVKELAPLLYSICHKYDKNGFDDIMQTAYLGLINAVNKYRYKKGAKFITYATYLIEGEIKHYLRDQVLIKEPRWSRTLYGEIREFISKFQNDEKRLPTINEIARGLNITEEGVIEVLKIKNSLNIGRLSDGHEATYPDDFDVEKIKSLKFETFHLPVEDRIILSEAMERLSEIQKEAVYYFFYKDLTQTEIAKKLGLTQRKISHLVNNAVKTLREFLGKEIW